MSIRTRVAAQLGDLGFAVHVRPDGVTRYVRDETKIDLLAPEGLGNKPIETSPPGRAVMAPGDAPDAGLDLADRILDNAVAQYAAG